MSGRLAWRSLGLLVLWAAGAACGLWTAMSQPPTPTLLPAEDLAGTVAAIVLTAQARASPSPSPAPTATPQPSPTLCRPTVTANVNANVREGPGTDYDVIGSLREGMSATVAGTDETATWWYIEFGSAFAWIAARVTTEHCIPNDLPVIAI